MSGYAAAITFVIIAPDEEPVTNALLAGTPQFAILYRTEFARPRASPPPLCTAKVSFVFTSQQC
jgi:hypothetical protein